MPAEALVNSSAISRASYRPEARELTVTSVTGRKYIYRDVSPDIHAAFLEAPSKGRFFNTEIRERYESDELSSGS
ncbi:MAG: KTSC domain-containing protein [Pseudomonadota bacterium]|nr:KTSC domain-containing protein [Pseudomonadota bacterium]